MRDKATARRLWTFFDLPVPQYASTPELIVSALAWTATEGGNSPAEVLGVETSGFVYQYAGDAPLSKDSQSGRKRIETAPREGDARLEVLGGFLADSMNVSADLHGANLATLFLIHRGNVPSKAKSRPVIPFNAYTALMQDPRGMVGTDRPPNFAEMMRRMYALGGGKGDAAELRACFKIFIWVQMMIG